MKKNTIDSYKKDSYDELVKKTKLISDKLKSEQMKRHNEILLKNNEIKFLKKKLKKVQNTKTEELKLAKDHIQLMEDQKNEHIRFFSLISHDLRSPLATLNGFLNLLIEDFDEMEKEEIKKIIYHLHTMTNNLSQLIVSLLSWVMQKLEKFDCEITKLDLKHLMDNNLELFQDNIQQKKITIINNIKNPVNIDSDIDILDTVVRNILSNAIKYTDIKGEIKLDITEDEKKIFFSISDNGMGIDKDRLDSLFNFSTIQPLSYNGSMGEKGSGIGLLLCKELIEKIGGQIKIESKSEIGTTVYITLIKNL